ncbi:Por secretion system C-terminal sorting domain-containing protein [Nonlabens sp. Hel1_33_55]|uniref:S8 family peptidase n=1 Tax=Nonlabens sp. Hel1_33_55 TaxID=1336802 RepID=UPI000875D4A4|nr:S8 family peptidase [Nonlabens sp. Hel1_33_55]SCY17399.1 Por secretion system C-terminal sorting domain-containing protein [Nonlabens sp. Hel1_33_55]
MKTLFTLMAMVFVTSLSAQELHALVYFKDKPNVQTSLENPSTILTQRALDRKLRHGVAVDERDVPVNQNYINTLKSQNGIDYRTQSKWFNAAHVVGTFENLEQLTNLDFVDRVDYADQTKSVSIDQDEKFDEEITLPADYGGATNQIEMIGLDDLHNRGFTGDNMWMAITDSGFPRVNVNRAFETARMEGRILGGYDFVAGDESIYGDNFHGARVFSIIAGQISEGNDQYIGTAPDASYFLFRTEDHRSETPVEMSYWVAAAERADSLGVDVVNVSLGYLGFDNSNESLTYQDIDGSSFISRGATTASEKGLLIVTSAGNFGRSSTYPWIGAPADAPGVFAIGAVTASGNKSDFSSIGPTVDGRIRPSVVAQGTATVLVEEIGDRVVTGNGTSYSGPVIAGAMACLLQAYPNLTPAQLMEAVQNSSSQGSNPDNQLGYGIPDFGETFQTLSGQELMQDENINYYVRDNVLYINAAQGESAVPFQLFNLQGQLLIDKKILQVDTVDLNAFTTGIYLFRIQEDAKAFKIGLK